MECRNLKITLVSAECLPDVRDFGKLKVYADVSINGESETIKRTPTDKKGKTNPSWNFPIEYIVSESVVERPGTELMITLYCKRTLCDGFVGKVSVPIKSLFDKKGLNANKILSYKVAETTRGRLYMSYSFGERKIVQIRHLESGRRLRSSRWKRVLEVGFLVLVGGLVLSFSVDADDDEQPHDAPALPAVSRGSTDDDGNGNVDQSYYDDDNGVQFYDVHSMYSEQD